ncbi:MAG: acyl-CoA dehydrogenase family protein [Hyphomicrobiaceae bacterium]
MDFDLSEEQQLLKDSVDRMTGARYAELKTRLALMKEAKGYSDGLWKEFAELGLLAIPFDDAHGGMGQGAVETMLVADAFGRALVLEPYFPTVILAGSALRLGASEAMKAKVIPSIVDGSLTLAFAHQEAQARFDLANVTTTAKADGKGGYVLEGAKCVVLGGDSAGKLVVSARVSGDRASKDGLALFLVDADAAGVTRRGYPIQDGTRAADITLSGVKVGADAVIGEPGKAFPIIERTIQNGIAYLAAEAVGAMSALHEMTVEYLKTRKQFGIAIGSFQVLQHRSVDMFVSVEQAKSMAYYACVMIDEPDATERRRAMHAVKAQISKSARHVGQEAIQLHGGIGMTMEYKGGHYFKRLTMIDLMFGSADHHLRELAKAGGLLTAA